MGGSRKKCKDGAKGYLVNATSRSTLAIQKSATINELNNQAPTVACCTYAGAIGNFFDDARLAEKTHEEIALHPGTNTRALHRLCTSREKMITVIEKEPPPWRSPCMRIQQNLED